MYTVTVTETETETETETATATEAPEMRNDYGYRVAKTRRMP